jgi:uncharacterized protein YbgA (DUF1722 family)
VSALWPRPRLRAVRDLVPDRLSWFVERVPPGPEPVDGLLVTRAEVVDTAARHPLAAVEDADRLSDPAVLHHFLTRLFQGARLRSVAPTAGGLVAFHTSSKLLLLAYAEPELRRLGRLVAEVRSGPAGVSARYREGFVRALGRPATPGGLADALWHAVGHFSRVLTPAEKQRFAALMEGWRAGCGSPDGALALIGQWSARHHRSWVSAQSLLEPYPAALREGALPALREPYPPALRQPYPPALREPYPPALREPCPPALREPYPPALREPYPPALRALPAGVGAFSCAGVAPCPPGGGRAA